MWKKFLMWWRKNFFTPAPSIERNWSWENPFPHFFSFFFSFDILLSILWLSFFLPFFLSFFFSIFPLLSFVSFPLTCFTLPSPNLLHYEERKKHTISDQKSERGFVFAFSFLQFTYLSFFFSETALECGKMEKVVKMTSNSKIEVRFSDLLGSYLWVQTPGKKWFE